MKISDFQLGLLKGHKGKGEDTVKVRKRLEGKLQYNDGELAEIQTVGTKGLEKDLLLDTVQFHREDTNDTPDEFRHRFPVGKWLNVSTTIEIGPKQSIDSK